MDEGIEMNSYNFNVRSFDNIRYSIDAQFLYQIDNIMIVIDYDNDLYRKHLKNWKQEEFAEKLKKNFCGDAKTYINEELGIFIICGDIEYPIHLVINEVFRHENGLTDEELISIGIFPVFKSDSLFYITMLQIKFFVSTEEMVSKFEELKKAFSEKNINDNV